jgi:hypothetical protein
MNHELRIDAGCVRTAEYAWDFGGEGHALSVKTSGPPEALRGGSEAEFITEHYWGYNRQRDGRTLEYRVEHPRWRVQEVSEARLTCDVGRLYGREFVDGLKRNPSSAFLAEGSPVTVRRGDFVE